MPQRMKTPCRHPGCPRLSRQRFCPEHAGDAYQHTDHHRGTPAERGYDRHWIRIAAHRRRLDMGLCRLCLRDGCVVAARTVDHIVPLHVRPDWPLEIRNTQVLCFTCHSRKTEHDNRRYGSSTETRLTTAQIENRKLAQGLRDPPRTEEPDMFDDE